MFLAVLLANAICATRIDPGPIGSAAEDYARVQELAGKAPVRPQLFRRWSGAPETILCSGGPAPHPSELPEATSAPDVELRLLPIEWRSYLNSSYPDDRNDGAVWEGRGLSTALTGGVKIKNNFFSAALAPLVAWQENRDFPHPPMTMPGYSPYANPYNYGQIDLPLRFGPSSFWTLDPGQSYARIDLWNVAAGVSTENLWWGPGVRNALIMTNSAPGIPHLFLGTSRPQDIWIGWLEAQVVWGRLSQSDWFMNDPSRSRRLFTALTLGFEPRWIRGLFLGLARVFVDRIPPQGLPASDYFPRLFRWPRAGQNDAENELGSLFFRWVFPESALELYGEWGRDDYSGSLKDFFTQPEHSSAYLAGLQKLFPIGARSLRFSIELAHTLEKPTNNPPRGVPIFYTHGDEWQGYTQRGQMLGAGIGPQADSQYVAVDLFQGPERAGLWFERVLRNDRYFYDVIHEMGGEDTEIAAGLRAFLTWRNFELDGSLGLGHRYNANFDRDRTGVKGLLSIAFVPR